MMFCLVKGYLFGRIYKLDRNYLYSLTSNLDESSLGYTIMQAMESEMIKEIQNEEKEREMNDIEIPKELDIEEKLQDEETF